MKVGFVHMLRGSQFTDITAARKGNPGYGGTEFCFSLLIIYLSERHKDCEYYVYSDSDLLLPSGCICRNVGMDYLRAAEEDGIDYLIMRTIMDPSFYQMVLSHYRLKVVCWSHNYFNAKVANALSSSPQVKAVVFVGKQQYDFYADHDVILKSTYIYNPVPGRGSEVRRVYSPNSAVYIGNITEDKGILHLLKLWRIVESRAPEATLDIIGSGKLYDQNFDVGEMGIASRELEKKIMPFILDEEGNIKNNIRFLGILGEEKYQVFERSSVGLVNPSAKTETFGMGIIEMASVGLPVVTRGWNGHFDTVINGKTGLTALSIPRMAKNVLRLFEDGEMNARLSSMAKENAKRFAPDLVSDQWHELLFGLDKGTFHRLKLSPPYWNNFKFLRGLNSFFRFSMRLSFLPSVVSAETWLHDIIKKIK